MPSLMEDLWSDLRSRGCTPSCPIDRAGLPLLFLAGSAERSSEHPLAKSVVKEAVVKESEAAAVEVEAVDFPEVDADRKDEATLHEAVAEEVLVPAVGAPQRGGVVACGWEWRATWSGFRW